MLRTSALLAATVALAQAQTESTLRMRVMPDGNIVGGASTGLRDTNSAQTRLPDVGMGDGQMYPGMNVWSDIGTSKWQGVPSWLMGVDTMVPSSITSATKTVEWQCAEAKYSGHLYCDAYVFIYHCPGCAFMDGGLAAELLADDWEPFRCTPTVEVNPGGNPHKMQGFHKRVPEATTATIVLSQDVGLVTYAIVRAGKDCTDPVVFPDEEACLHPKHNGQCDWVDGSCVLSRCMPIGPGPDDHCSKRQCLPQEITALPEPIPLP